MLAPKPTTLWAVASIIFGILGCLATLAFVAMAERYGEIANASAGVGGIWMGLHLLVAAALCMHGVLFGLIALIRIRGGRYGGRGKAWAGIVMGCLPVAAAVVLLFIGNSDRSFLR